jgi:hypothetical protein
MSKQKEKAWRQRVATDTKAYIEAIARLELSSSEEKRERVFRKG